MTEQETTPLHMIDLIRRKRDGGALNTRELEFVARGAAEESIPAEQLAAWLMAAWLRGLSIEETRERSSTRADWENTRSTSIPRAAWATRRVSWLRRWPPRAAWLCR
jgi:anthranilate phosphoribosyltransferase